MTTATNTAKTFAFPARRNLDAFEREATQAREAHLEAARADAIARGYAEGLVRGREEAKAAAQELLETSRRDGSERGRIEGLAEMNAAAASLHSALIAFEHDRANIVAEAEAFCVDLALAIVARMVEADKTRVEFVRRATQSALKALAPAAPTAVFLSPADCKAAAKAMSDLPVREDETLAPGTARVEAGRLLIESSIDEAFAQIRAAVLESKAKRAPKKSDAASLPDASAETIDAV